MPLMEQNAALNVALRIVAAVLLSALMFFIIERGAWNFWESVYFTVISASTVGYGDHAPDTVLGKWVSVVWLPFIVLFVGSQMSKAADIILGDKQVGWVEVRIEGKFVVV